MIDISHIPSQPGIYIFKTNSGKILYIGKAKDLKKRVSQYFSPGSVWKQDMVGKSDKVDFLVVNSESEAVLLETSLIKQHLPPYNSLLKGDHAYVYIKITKEKFPRIYLTRFKENDGAIYIGPKSMRNELKKLLHFLRQFLGYRTCAYSLFKQKKLCSDAIFGMCRGRCQMQENSDYKNIISIIVDFFKGNSKSIENELLSQIDTAIQKQNFEWAAKLRDIYMNISKFIEKQNVVLDTDITGYFWQIREIGGSAVYAILNFYEGRLIDIIRYKENLKDTELDDIISRFTNEFGEFKIDGNFGYSKSIKKIKKENIQEIKNLMDSFIDSFLLSTSFDEDSLLDIILKDLKRKYDLKNFPYRIEASDISHLSGGWVSGSVVCMLGGVPNPKGYRRYKITGLQKGKSDDYYSLKQVIDRRMKSNQNLPDLFIIDGGKGQLNIIKDMLKEEYFQDIFTKVEFASIGKGKSRERKNKLEGEKEKLYKFDENMEIMEFEMNYDEADRLILKLRDEAHRFANKYREKQMSKEFKNDVEKRR